MDMCIEYRGVIRTPLNALQDNYYYLCTAMDKLASQQLDDYEAQESYTLEYVEPHVAINKNCNGKNRPYNQLMFEREA